MSFFEHWQWSIAPERRSIDRILSTIPNEIYIYIFDIVAPPQDYLWPWHTKILSNSSCVCRLFANICLPRIYESLYFDGSSLRHFGKPEGSFLIAQIAAEQPLALALAGVVRMCDFTQWGKDPDVGLSERRLYTTAMSHMKNIREVRFTKCNVGKEHWTALATLPSLETLDITDGSFLYAPANLEPKIKVKVSQLCLFDCLGSGRFIPVIEMRNLRTCLACYGDLVIANDTQPGQPWLYQPHFTDLHICVFDSWGSRAYPWVLGSVLRDAPGSLETLTFSCDMLFACRVVADILETISECRREWTALLSLRSLTLGWDDDMVNMSMITRELSQSINDYLPKVPVALRHLGPASSLRRMDYFGTVFHLADGEWLKGVS